ncbi:MAG: amidohydrolase family protein [Proteobacteria bacterium]|nr:amidohydrolase family protein [Pseudomonadota bacterium]
MANLIHGPDRQPIPPINPPPRCACDCHAHLYGPFSLFPIDPAKGDGPDTSFEDYRAMLDVLGIDRAVLVQARDYGGIDPVTLDAIARSGGRCRGIAMLSPEALDDNLDILIEGGFRGIRLSTFSKSMFGPQMLDLYLPRLRELGWIILFHLRNIDEMIELAPRLRALDVPVMIDHLGRIDGSQPLDHPGFQALLDLLRETDHCWAKICSWYRLSKLGTPYDDMAPFARALIETRPDRLVWGSNWPHPNSPVAIPNDGFLLDQLMGWAGDDATRQKILVDNPATLFGFD